MNKMHDPGSTPELDARLTELAVKDPEKAIAIFSDMLSSDPTNPALLNIRASFKTQLKDFKGAIQDYSDAITCDQDNADLYIERGRCYESIDKRRNALRDYKKAFSIEDSEKTRKELFKGYLTNKYFSRALVFYTDLNEVDLNFYSGELLEFAQYLAEKGKHRAALIILGKLKYNDRFYTYEPQDVQEYIDSIEEELSQIQKDRIRKSVFRDSRELEKLFWSLTENMKYKSVPLKGFFDLSIIIFIKRLLDTLADQNQNSPFELNGTIALFHEHVLQLEATKTHSEAKPENEPVNLIDILVLDDHLSQATQELRKDNPKMVDRIVHLLSEYDFSISNIPIGVFGPAYDSFISNFSSLPTVKRGDLISPYLVSSLIKRKLIRGDHHSILDPAMGAGSLLSPNHAHLPQGEKLETQVFGYEIDKYSFLLSFMNLIMNGIYNPYIQKDDFFTGYPVMESVDLVVCHPPFGRKVSPKGFYNEVSPYPDYPISRIEYAFLQHMLPSVKEGGEFAIVIPTDILSDSGANREFRKYLVENDYINSVVGLPERSMPNTSVKAAILYGTTRKRPRIDPKVEFSVIRNSSTQSFTQSESLIDHLWDNRDSIEVSVSDILKLGVSLNPESYTSVKFATMLRYMEPGYPEQVMLDMVLKSAKSGVSGKVDKTGPGFPVPYIGLGDLLKDPWEEDLRIHTDWMDINDQQKAYDVDPNFLIKESCILISLVGKELKPTVFRYDSIPIVIGRDILALVPDLERITLEYLLYELDNMLVLDQLQFARTATGIGRLRVGDLRKVVLNVPSIERQNYEINANRRFLYGNQRQVEEALKQDLEKVKQDFNSALRLIRHQLDGLIGGAQLYNSSLQMYFASRYPEILSDVIGEAQAEDGGNETGTSVSQVMERLSGSLTQMGSELRIIKIITSGLENGPEKQLISLFDILESIKQEVDSELVTLHLPKQARITYQGADTTKTLLADPEMIETAVRQIAENAIQHGQIKGRHLNIWIETKTGVPYKGTYCLQLIVRNDGKPLHEDFNLEMYRKLGEGAGESMNSGVGGNLVHRVIEAHDGEIVRMETLPNGQVEMEIMIPHPMED